MKETDLTWLAGLLEGEGCFSKCGRSHMIHLKMKDRDVVERAAELMNSKVNCYHKKIHPNWEDTWTTYVCGERARAVMQAVLPHMGARRSQRIIGILLDPSWGFGRQPQRPKLKPGEVVLVRILAKAGVLQKKIAPMLQVTPGLISQAVRGVRAYGSGN